MKKWVLLTAMVVFCFQHLSATEDSAKQQEAIQKVDQAAAKTNIFELPSFQMKANVQIESQGKLVDGRVYRLCREMVPISGGK